MSLSENALPNMRVQQTRSSASGHRSPLTRYLLGGPAMIIECGPRRVF